MQPQRPFFLVWNPQGHNPSHRHSTFESADAECKRLARINPGQEFYVLSSVRKISTVTFNIVDYEDAPGWPAPTPF